MIEPLEQLHLALKEHGYSLTAARRAVFEALQNKEPQAMHEIIVACGSKADRASVYRTAGLFEKLGIIQRLQIGWKYKLELSDVFHHHHHHLSCGRCGKVLVLPEDAVLERHIHALAAAHGFRPTDHQL